MRADESSQLKISLDAQAASTDVAVGSALLRTAAVAGAHDASTVALSPAPDVATSGGSRLVGVLGEVSSKASGDLLDALVSARARLVVDTGTLCVAATAALLSFPALAGRSDVWLTAAFAFLALGLLVSRPDPGSRLHASALDQVAHALAATSLSAMLTIAAGSVTAGAHHVALSLRLWVFTSLSLSVARVALLSLRRYAISKHALATPTLIVGAGAVGTQIARRLFADTRYGLRPVGFLDTAPLPSHTRSRTPSVPVLSGLSDLRDAVIQLGARHVILAFTSEPDHVLVQKVRECQELGVEVSLVPRLYEAINGRVIVDHIGGLPLLSLRGTNPRGWQFAVKHAFDRAFALIMLVLLAPLMIAIAITVRATSPGGALFRQRRVGRDGRTFELLKFRTMVDADSTSAFSLPDGRAPGGVEGKDRRTWVGRWLRDMSLDELPQLINVLRGEMSLVGPRPERPEFVERFDLEIDHYVDRRRVKSGITGWAQVHGLRGQTSITDRVEWDNYYIDNWSLWLDLRIIALTVAEMFQFRDSAAVITE